MIGPVEKTGIVPLSEIDYAVYLLGDAGKLMPGKKDELFPYFSQRLERENENSVLLFLGDNIYPSGLPPKGDKNRKTAEYVVKTQTDILKNFKGKAFYISGNHDWNKGKSDGWEWVVRQEKYIEKIANRGNIYLPDNGCPGPVEVDLNEKLRLIFINTQWWMQKGFRPLGEEYGCGVKKELDFFRKLDDMLARSNKATVIVAHHPLYSKSLHGGKFHLKHHIFPLRFLHKKLYIPLPGAGSLYTLYRKLFGAREDIAYPTYRRMKKKLMKVMKKHKNIIYTAGHEHNLQYIYKHNHHFLISGSGSKSAFVSSGGSAIFTSDKKGFLKLNFMKDRSVILEAWNVDRKHPDGFCIHTGMLEGDIRY